MFLVSDLKFIFRLDAIIFEYFQSSFQIVNHFNNKKKTNYKPYKLKEADIF